MQVKGSASQWDLITRHESAHIKLRPYVSPFLLSLKETAYSSIQKWVRHENTAPRLRASRLAAMAHLMRAALSPLSLGTPEFREKISTLVRFLYPTGISPVYSRILVATTRQAGNMGMFGIVTIRQAGNMGMLGIVTIRQAGNMGMLGIVTIRQAGNMGMLGIVTIRRAGNMGMLGIVGGFSRGSPVSHPLSFRRCSILTSITIIGSQDLDVKSHPNLFTFYSDTSQTKNFLFSDTSELHKSVARNSDPQPYAIPAAGFKNLRNFINSLLNVGVDTVSRILSWASWNSGKPSDLHSVVPGFELRSGHPDLVSPWFPGITPGECWRTERLVVVSEQIVPPVEQLQKCIDCSHVRTSLPRATVVERLGRSPPTKAIRFQSPAGSPDFRKWESYRTMPLVGGSSWGISRFPRPFIPAMLHIYFSHPHRLSRPRC
ncbi:hypothetical protein PR048_019121 [Dryococelus australis]|uniref:Uncharacterized protein n=1 Tax=Dryococelus australis TaxID=614101 RepID=A0ABQ9H2Y3_9NEOP|nr:hypothetical protein PR048_019121 [Dryococelus australis]